MGSHSSWRKIAKRERRRRIRKQNAAGRDIFSKLKKEEYQKWINEQHALEQLEYELIEKSNMEENKKWLESERIAKKMWQQLQEHKEKLRQQQLEQEAKRQIEWELEQEKKRMEEERLKEIEEANRQKQEVFMHKLEEFLAGDSSEPPPELMVSRQTRPECDPCPFFGKTACCRFGDTCSRNHVFPGISKVLLATNFYTHFGLDNASYTEYDTDVMLEYEESDTYKEFKEFFHDVVPEFEKFGEIIQFKVCNNFEKHLRGNVYIEFAELRCAVAAYRAMHSRWYGGKQLSLQFCNIGSWKNAICGLYARKRCPKGRSCNYCHVFKTPNNMYDSYQRETRTQESERNSTWRWSESPEIELPRERLPRSRDRRIRSKDRPKARSRSRDRPRARSRSRDRLRARSRSRERRRRRSRSKHRRRRSISRERTKRRSKSPDTSKRRESRKDSNNSIDNNNDTENKQKFNNECEMSKTDKTTKL